MSDEQFVTEKEAEAWVRFAAALIATPKMSVEDAGSIADDLLARYRARRVELDGETG